MFATPDDAHRGMRRPTAITPPNGTLGVLTPGLGAVSTTFMAGVELVRKGLAPPVGSLTQLGTIRLGKRTEGRSPLIGQFVPLESLDNLVFGGWDIFPDSAYEAASKAGVLASHHLAEVKGLLSGIWPMKAAFDRAYVKRLDGTHVKTGKTKFDLAEAIKDDIQQFKKESGAQRLVMVWCGSTEVFLTPTEVHADPARFEKAMKTNDPAIAPSMLYAWAAITSGIPFANGAPNLTVDIPALQELAREHDVPVCGKDFKTGQTLLKTILAPGFKARLLGLTGWFSTNILGNRDGEVLDDPGSFRTKEESKLGALEYILASALPAAVRQAVPQGAHQLLPAAWRQQRGLGQHRYLRLARLPHADQGGLPLSRFDPGGADCARPGALPRPGTARRAARHPGVAELLFQVADVRAGALSRARSVHPVDERSEER